MHNDITNIIMLYNNMAERETDSIESRLPIPAIINPCISAVHTFECVSLKYCLYNF